MHLKTPLAIGNDGFVRWVSSFSDNIIGAKKLNSCTQMLMEKKVVVHYVHTQKC